MEEALQPVTWPTEIHCHNDDWGAQRFAPHSWRPAGVRLHPDNDQTPAFRTCSYCGSMHPQDLLAALEHGAEAHFADRKYGWPHKIYLDGIPDPRVGEPRQVASMSLGLDRDGNPVEPTPAQRQQWSRWVLKVNQFDGKARWHGIQLEPAPAKTHGKFYCAHLRDLSGEAFDLMSLLIHQKTGVHFEMVDGKLMYYG